MQANKQIRGVGAKFNHWILRVPILLGSLSRTLGKVENKQIGYNLKPKRKLITLSYHVIFTSTTHHEHNKNDDYPKPIETHQHIVNTTSMATILSQKKHLNTS